MKRVYVIMPLDEIRNSILRRMILLIWPENDDFVEPAPEALSEIGKEPAVADEQFYLGH